MKNWITFVRHHVHLCPKVQRTERKSSESPTNERSRLHDKISSCSQHGHCHPSEESRVRREQSLESTSKYNAMKVVKSSLFLVFTSSLFLPSCAGPSQREIGWLSVSEVRPEASDWSPIDPKRFFWVRKSRLADAELLLMFVDSVEIPRRQAFHLAPNEFAAPGFKAFLVRGVCYGDAPTFASVFHSQSTRRLHVHQVTAQAELYFPGAMERPQLQHRPVIVWLETAPLSIHVTADHGGDSALRVFRPAHSKFYPQSSESEQDHSEL